MRSLLKAGARSLALIMIMAVASPALSVEAGITAALEPEQFSMDDAGRLTVTMYGASFTEPVLPSVKGLRFLPAGESSHVRAFGGVVSSIKTYTYVVAGDKPGSYTIAPIQAVIDGEAHQAGPLSLKVVQGKGSHGALRSPSVSSGGRARFNTDTVFLRVQPSKASAYVGELVPVQVKAYIMDGLAVSSIELPSLHGSDFTIHSLSNEPERAREVVGGRVFSVLTWYTGMSAVKEGDLPVSAQLKATLLVPERSGSRRNRSHFFRGSHFDSFFDEDLFSNFFGRIQEETVTLFSTDKEIRVKLLPEQGRPGSFSGAVGNFEISASATPRELTAGDPVTLRIDVRGYGNFDRVSKPLLKNEDGMKVYPAEADFQSRDTVGFEGVKTFEQVVIPQEDSLTEIPPLTFSFFDPESAGYRTVFTFPLPIAVARAPSTHSASLPDDTLSAGAPPPASARLHLEPGPLIHSLRPALFRPGFWGFQTLPLSALVLGVHLRRRRLNLERSAFLSRRRAARYAAGKAMSSMEHAIRGMDVPGFFMAYRRAVQERLGLLWEMEPLAITLADLRRRLPQASEVHEGFETADAAVYSGQTFSQEELRVYRDALKKEFSTWKD